MLVANEEGLRTARKYKTELLKKLFPKTVLQEITAQALGKEDSIRLIDLPPSNIIGLGYGSKEANGKSQGEIAVRVYVREKLPNSQVSLKEKIPSEINGTPTDVIPVGDICALARPARGGTSIGHHRVTAGTLGCLVVLFNGKPNEYYILSNNHVLANCNDSQLGESILEPGYNDGGQHAIAVLTDYERLQFEENHSNEMDAAIAKVLNCNEVIPEIITIGRVQRPATDAYEGQPVCKYGRTTHYSDGIVKDISFDGLSIKYPNGRSASFENQIAIKGTTRSGFSDEGDSGSLVVHAETKQPVALLFAGITGGNLSFATPIDRIIRRFNIDFPASDS